MSVFFFFQAEDGIRDLYVTGVQTCALPISVLGTVSARWPGGSRAARHTTPESTELQATLATARAAGARLGILEISSHALAQERAAGLAFDAAGFTNLKIGRAHV